MKKTSNLDGLDLELSQSISNGFDVLRKQDRELSDKKEVIKKNELLDSLDLNVGMDALLQLQNVWGKKKKSKVVVPEKERPIFVSKKVEE